MQIKKNVTLAPLTTIQLGGRARYFARCSSVDELREAIEYAREHGLKVHVLSGGSNTIFQDEGFDGLVVKIDLRGIEFGPVRSRPAEGTATAAQGRPASNGMGDVVEAKVAAGEDWDSFVAECVKRNLAGVECMSGVPGSVGATPIQNVGAYGQQVSDVIVSIKTLEVATLRERVFQSSQCGFDYRSSRFKYEDAGKYIVTGVTYQLHLGGDPCVEYDKVREAVVSLVTTSGVVTLGDVRDAVLGLRKKKSMVIDERDPNSRSCGSFFENMLVEDVPDSIGMPTFDENGRTRVSSAWLIEKAGFEKGYQQGGVGISPNHNLALVNYGGTTKELLELAEEIKAAVKEKFGVELKREPVAAE